MRIQRVVLEHHRDVAVLGRNLVDDTIADRELAPRDLLPKPAIIRSAVDFPQPDGPTSTRNSESATCRSSSCTAWNPFGYTLSIESRTISAMVTSPFQPAASGPSAAPGVRVVDHVVTSSLAVCRTGKSISCARSSSASPVTMNCAASWASIVRNPQPGQATDPIQVDATRIETWRVPRFDRADRHRPC